MLPGHQCPLSCLVYAPAKNTGQTESVDGELENYSEISLTADIGFGYRIVELTRNAKVAEFDLPFAVDQNIGGLDVYRMFRGKQ
jgi:hypothetical protein